MLTKVVNYCSCTMVIQYANILYLYYVNIINTLFIFIININIFIFIISIFLPSYAIFRFFFFSLSLWLEFGRTLKRPHNVSSYLLEQLLLSFRHFWCRGKVLKQSYSVCPLDRSCLVDDWCWCLMVRVWLIASVIVQIAYPWCQGPIGLITSLPWIQVFAV